MSPEARALLEAAREGLSPSPAAIHRIRAKVGASAAAAGAGGTALALKLGLLSVVAVVAIGAGVYATRRGPEPVVPRLELAAAPAPEPARLAVHEGAPPPALVVAPEAVSPAVPASPAVVVASEHHDHAAIAHPPIAATTDGNAAPRPTRSAVDLAREVELVDTAMTALKGGDPRAALAAVHQHASETRGQGQLAEDAAAIEVEALCRLHDPSTNAKLEAFDARFPKSAQRSRLSNRCP